MAPCGALWRLVAPCGSGVLALLERVCSLGACSLEACSLEALGPGSLDADSTAWRPGGLGGLAAWIVMAMMMRAGMRMLMNDDDDEDWKDFSHARA